MLWYFSQWVLRYHRGGALEKYGCVGWTWVFGESHGFLDFAGEAATVIDIIRAVILFG